MRGLDQLFQREVITLEPLGISKLARKAHVGQTPTRVKSKEQRAEANWTKYVDLHNCAVWV